MTQENANSLLAGKAILITGGLGGSAEFILKRLSHAAARLLVTDVLDCSEGNRRLNDWGIPADQREYRRMDVTNEVEVADVISSFFHDYSHLDIALGHAGGCDLHPFPNTSSAEYDRIFRFNYHGQVYFARAVLSNWSRLDTRGHLIFTSSVVASLPWPDVSAYSSAKAALEAFVRCLALEYSARGMRFNVVAPGVIAVGRARKVYESDIEYRAIVDRATPLKGLVSPDAIADAFLWLCSPLASEVNGQVIKVDRGLSLPKVG